MVGGLIVTHGNLAYELLKAAQKIEASVSGIEAVPLEWTDSVDEAREKIGKALERLGPDRGVIIFTDMFGGTPSNLAISCMSNPKVEVLAGINLPMLIKLAKVRMCAGLTDAVAKAQEAGRKYVTIASQVLAGK